VTDKKERFEAHTLYLFQREVIMIKSLLTDIVLSFMLALVVAGCATMQSIDISNRSRIMDADYATTLKAAVDYLNSEAWQITAIDKELGLINTEFKSGSGLSAILSGGERYKLNFSVQKYSATKTKIIANMLYETKSGGHLHSEGTWAQANLTEKDAIEKYERVLGGIQSKIAN
jgi:uncharacterized protein YceK